MRKMEFLEQLQEELGGQLSVGELREHIEYYSEYIDSEILKGLSEEEVLNDLGDPWAIAHNILDDKERREGKEAAREEQAERDAQADRDYAHQQRTGGAGTYWLILLIAILVVVVIVSVVLGILGFLWRTFPLLAVILVIAWVIHKLRN